MVQIDRDARRGLEQQASWRQLNFRRLQEAGREKGFLVGQFVASDFLPQNICAFGDQELGRDQLRALAKF